MNHKMCGHYYGMHPASYTVVVTIAWYTPVRLMELTGCNPKYCAINCRQGGIGMGS